MTHSLSISCSGKGVIFLTVQDIFSPGASIARSLFMPDAAPWEPLGGIERFIMDVGPHLGDDYYSPADGVWIALDAKIASSVCITGPCIIDHGTELRHGAFIRGRAVIGRGCVVGNSTEIKNSILLDGAQAPHFNYVGDSILGAGAHIGAGVITANVKCDKKSVTVHLPEGEIQTGLRKLGALIGDGAEIGCGTVLCPGAVIGPGAVVYPMSRVRGHVPGSHIYKSRNDIVKKHSMG